MTHTTKLTIAVIGLAMLFAPAAEAAKRKHRTQAHPVARAEPARFALTPGSPNTVWYGNEYLGADPDPRIRHELLRDLGAHFGGQM